MKVIGIGNDLRGDDAVGLEVVRGIHDARTDIDTALHQRDGIGLLELWRGAGAVVLVDAMRSGRPPGTVDRIEVSTVSLPASMSFGSSHAVGVGEAIELARALGELPARVVIYGIEGAQFDLGRGLSDEVAASVSDVVAAACREARLLVP